MPVRPDPRPAERLAPPSRPRSQLRPLDPAGALHVVVRFVVALAAAAVVLGVALSATAVARAHPPQQPAASTADALPVPAQPAPVVVAGTTAVSRVLPFATPDTGWPALDAAIMRIPGYLDAAPTTWQVTDRYGHAGSTLLPAEEVLIDPAVPPRLLDSVVRHEWSHVLQSRVYGGDRPAMVAALDAAFGGQGARGVDGVEDAADCMALQLGATWTHYTRCASPAWRTAAAALLAGHRV